MFGRLTKLESLVFCFFKNFKSLAFGGLGELFNSSLAIENPSFRRLTIWTQDYVNHKNLVDYVFNKILKMDLSVALVNFSIAH